MRTKDIYLVDLNPTKGAEIKKARPCIIVSNNNIGILPLKIVVPLIGHKDIHKNKSWLVTIKPSSINNLTKTSTADTLNMRSVSDSRFIKKIGMISQEDYNKLIEAMRIALNI